MATVMGGRKLGLSSVPELALFSGPALALANGPALALANGPALALVSGPKLALAMRHLKCSKQLGMNTAKAAVRHHHNAVKRAGLRHQGSDQGIDILLQLRRHRTRFNNGLQ